MSRKFACLYLAVALLVSSIWIASADERDTVQQEVQYSAAVEALDAAGLTSRSSNVLPSGEGLALALELGLPEEETISLSQLPTEALKTSQAQEDAARRKQADTAAAAADAAAKEAARQSLLSEYDGVQLTEAVRLRSAADNDTATSLTIERQGGPPQRLSGRLVPGNLRPVHRLHPRRVCPAGPLCRL